MPVCACGCGEEFTQDRVRNTRPQRFIRNHHFRLPRKETPTTLTPRLRKQLYEAAGDVCQQCGRTMAEQVATFGRRLEIHHINHVHEDNTPGNHAVLCTGCHNYESLVVRDEESKGATFTRRYQAGLIRRASKIGPDDVREIRAQAARGITQQTIADQFGIGRTAVSLIVSRKRWGHIE